MALLTARARLLLLCKVLATTPLNTCSSAIASAMLCILIGVSLCSLGRVPLGNVGLALPTQLSPPSIACCVRIITGPQRVLVLPVVRPQSKPPAFGFALRKHADAARGMVGGFSGPSSHT